MEGIADFHNLLLVIIISIATFVTLLLLYVITRFKASNNPVPSKTTHNTLLEVLWTVVPVLILMVIAIPSFKLLYFEDRAADAEMTVKVTGEQWYWTYEYPDNGGFTFDSMILDEGELGEHPRLLGVDNPVVLPVDTTVRVLLAAPVTGVIHSWAVPSLGVKTDTVPGRLNETWLRINEEGWYYGQCSELCGPGHGFMPIAIKAISKEAFGAWVTGAQKEFARNDQGDKFVRVVQNQILQ
jgi:cytochrome c oxidase subunit 2